MVAKIIELYNNFKPMTGPDNILLPTSKDYFRAASEVDLDFDNAGGALEYLKKYHNTNVERSGIYRAFYNKIEQFGGIIEPIDRSTNIPFSDNFDNARVVIKGGLAGLVLAGRVHRLLPVTQLALDNVKIGLPNSEDHESNKDVIARQFIDIGWQGLDRMDDATKRLIEKWEDDAVLSANSHLFRIAIGIVATGAYALHEKKQFEFQIETVRTDDHWDGALRELLRPQDPLNDPSQ